LYIISEFFVRPKYVESAIETAKASGITDPAALNLATADAYPHYLHIMAILFVMNAIIMIIIGIKIY